jgi:hypothetical protein
MFSFLYRDFWILLTPTCMVSVVVALHRCHRVPTQALINLPGQLFRSPPSTPLGGSHDTHTQEAATQVGSGGGDGDEADDLTNYMVSFPKERHVTNTGTLKGTFMVNEEGLPLKQVKVPGNF